MKRSMILKLALLALPLAVVAIAISPGSVTVMQGSELRYTSFAEAVAGSSVGWCAPVTLLMTYGIFGLAVFYLLTKKLTLLKLVRAAAFLAACLSGCPVLIKGSVWVVPNVFVAILMMAIWGLSYYMLHVEKKSEAAAPKGHRLSGK